MREEQLKALNEQDIHRPGEKDKRKSGLGAFTSAFKSKRKSTPTEGPSTATGEKPVESQRSSTSLESSSSDKEGAAVAAHSADFKGKGKAIEEEPPTAAAAPAAPIVLPAEKPGSSLPKHEEAVATRIAIPVEPTVETTVTTGNKSEDISPKESGKKASWFRRLSRRTSKAPKPEDPSRKEKSEPKDSAIVKEPITGLPMDTSKENPGFGTDHIPHIAPEDPLPSEGAATSAADAPTVQPVTSATSATINPAVDSGITPAEIDAAAAKDEFAEPTEATKTGHMPTAKNTIPGEFLPAYLQPEAEPDSSERDVALAGKTERPSRSRSTSLSSMSSDAPVTSARGRTSAVSGISGVSGMPETETGGAAGLEPSGFSEGGMEKMDTDASGGEDFQEAQEAQDTLNTEDLPMPAFKKERAAGDSPHRETRFREEL